MIWVLVFGLAACGGSPEEEEWRVMAAAPMEGASDRLAAGLDWAESLPGGGAPSHEGSELRGAVLRELPPAADAPAEPAAPAPPAPPPTTPASPTQPPAPPPAPAAPAAPAPAAPAAPPPAAAPAKLPTWVPLDWAAFPVDRGPSYSASRVWEVSPGGNDAGAGTAASPLRTIAAALARALPGQMVRVQSGTYVEGVAGQNYALRMAQNNVVLTAAPGAAVTVKPATANHRFGIVLQGSQLVVNGINLTGFRPGIHYGRSDVTQRDIVISNLTVTAVGTGFSDGIASYADARTKGFPIIDGLLLKKVNVLGHGLSISCNAGPCRSWRLEDVKVVGNASGAGNSGADAIAIEQGDNMLFLRVDVSGSSADGIDTKATRVVVWNSHVHHVARNGIKLWWGGDVVNSCIHDTGADAALVVKAGDRVRILHSTIANASLKGNAYAMTFRYDDNGPIQVEILNSVVTNFTGPIYVSSAGKLVMQNSVLHAPASPKILTHGALNVTASTGATMLGAGNVIGNPGLDAAFRPVAGSISVNRAKPLPPLYPTSDLDGQPRIKGPAPDSGAFESF